MNQQAQNKVSQDLCEKDISESQSKSMKEKLEQQYKSSKSANNQNIEEEEDIEAKDEQYSRQSGFQQSQDMYYLERQFSSQQNEQEIQKKSEQKSKQIQKVVNKNRNNGYGKYQDKNFRPLKIPAHKRPKNRQILTQKTVRNIITYFNSQKDYGLSLIAKRLGLSLKKLNQARNQYYETGKIKTTEEWRKERKSDDGEVIGSISKRFKEATSIIQQLLAQEPTISAVKIRKQLLKRDVNVKQRSINHLLHRQGYIYRRLGQSTFSKNTPDIIEQRFQYTQQLKLYNIDQVVFVGQTTFSVGRVGCYGWIRREEYQNYKPADNPNNISVLAVANVKGFLGLLIKIGPIEAGQVFNLLIDNILPVIRQTDALIIGSLKVSSAEQIKGYFRDHELVVKDIPSFSPQLNPLQGFYSLIKVNFRRLREQKRLKDPQALLNLATQLIEEQKEVDLQVHFKKMKEQFRIAQRRGQFEHIL